MSLTTNEIAAIRTEYATEDIQMLIDNGCMSVTDTTVGVIHLGYEEGKFTALNSKAEALIGDHMNQERMIEWLGSKYSVENN